MVGDDDVEIGAERAAVRSRRMEIAFAPSVIGAGALLKETTK